MQPKRTSIWSHDSNKTASGKPGTLHIEPIDAKIYPVNEYNRELMSQADFAAAHPEFDHDAHARIEISQSEERLSVSSQTSVSSARGDLLRYEPPITSSVSSTLMTWEDFKSEVAKLAPDNFVWRGQSDPWSLQTSFHRTGRVDIQRYVLEDINYLKSALLPHTKTFFELSSPLLERFSTVMNRWGIPAGRDF